MKQTDAHLAKLPLHNIAVVEWSPDDSKVPTAVAIVINVGTPENFVLRLDSRQAVDTMIAALSRHADTVFGKRS